MITSSPQHVGFYPSQFKATARLTDLLRFVAFALWFCVTVGVVHAQTSSVGESSESVIEISGVTNSTVFGMGKTIRITGTVKQGAIACGGDVIVAGIVEGDVASIGGSVVQLAGAKIGGDVIVMGGTYKHVDTAPQRNSLLNDNHVCRLSRGDSQHHAKPDRFVTTYLVLRLPGYKTPRDCFLVYCCVGTYGSDAGNDKPRIGTFAVNEPQGCVDRQYWCARRFCRRSGKPLDSTANDRHPRRCHVVDVNARGLALWTCCIGGGNWKVASAEIHSTCKAL